MKRTRLAAICVLLLWSSSDLSAATSGQANYGQRQEVRQVPQPTFRVTPLIHRARVLPGQETAFSFEVEALRGAVELQLEPVGLAQNAAGLITTDMRQPPLGKMRLITPSVIRMREGEKKTIRGAWQTPAGPGGYAMAGLLVTDLRSGKRTNPAQSKAAQNSASLLEPIPADAASERSACVRFVSRYLLRLEAAYPVRSGGQQLPEVVQAKLVDRQGFAVVSATLDTHSCGCVHTRAWARLLQEDGEPLGAPFRLALPVRAALATADRWEVPLLAGRQATVIAPTPEPIFPGRYQLEISLEKQDATREVKRFPIEVGAEEFPAQRSVVARIVSNVEVSPRQIELSVARGGNRIVPLKLRNRGRSRVDVRLAGTDGSPLPEWLVVRPDRFKLPARGVRNVMVAVRGGSQASQHRYTHLAAHVSSEETSSTGTQLLPVALLAAERSGSQSRKTSVHIAGPIRYERSNNAAAASRLVLPLANKGRRHADPSVQVLITSSKGRQVEASGGYGKWVLPGESQAIVVPVESLTAGAYDVQLKLRCERCSEPRVENYRIVVGGPPSGDGG